jgi:hypothetical protein
MTPWMVQTSRKTITGSCRIGGIAASVSYEVRTGTVSKPSPHIATRSALAAAWGGRTRYGTAGPA